MKKKDDIFTKAMGWKEIQAIINQTKDDGIIETTRQSGEIYQATSPSKPATLAQPDFTRAMNGKEIQAIAQQADEANSVEELPVPIESELTGSLSNLEN